MREKSLHCESSYLSFYLAAFRSQHLMVNSQGSYTGNSISKTCGEYWFNDCSLSKNIDVQMISLILVNHKYAFMSKATTMLTKPETCRIIIVACPMYHPNLIWCGRTFRLSFIIEGTFIPRTSVVRHVFACNRRSRFRPLYYDQVHQKVRMVPEFASTLLSTSEVAMSVYE